MGTKKVLLKHRVVVAVVLVLIPVSLVFVAISRTATHRLEGQVAEANHSSLHIYHNLLETEVLNTERALNRLAYSSEAFADFAAEWDMASAEAGGSAIAEQFGEEFDSNPDVVCLALANTKTGYFQAEFNNVTAYENVKEDVRTLARATLEQATLPVGWFLHMGEGRSFLCRAMGRNGAGVLAVIDLAQAKKNSVLYYGQKGEIVFFQNARILANEAFVESAGIQLDYGIEGDHYFSGHNSGYLVVQKQLLNFKVALVLPFERHSGPMQLFYLSPYLYIAVALATLAIVFWYLQRALFAPLNVLVATMEQIQGGDLSARLPPQRTPEFAKVQTTFNSMVSELSGLRIRSYEQQLAAERAQLAALRLQIRPHFYLNCLKSIFGLVQAGRAAQSQQAVLHLSSHLRYVFDIDTDVISLEKELKMCENYIRLQQACESGRPEIEISMDTAVMEVAVPPVSCLTLVENCMKHGMDQNGALRIQVQAKMLEIDGQKLVDIVVRDDGPGFSADALKRLEDMAGPQQQGAGADMGTGLLNTIRRFRVLYGEVCVFRFSNSGGARTEILFALEAPGAEDV